MPEIPEDNPLPEPPLLTEAAPRRPRPGKTKWLAFAVIALVLAAVVFVYQYEPVANKQFYPQCGFKRMTGLDCPGCGGLRSVHAITNGRPVAAFRNHPALVLSLPILVFMFGLWLREWRQTGELPIPLASTSCNRPLIWIAVLFVAIGVIRLIPVKPFSWLATPPIHTEQPGAK
jgi:hypothetical protein